MSPGRAARARAFVGLPLEPEHGTRLAEAAAALLPSSAWRLARPAGLHATLLFLGAVERERLTALFGPLERVLASCPAPRLRLGAAGGFPSLARARVLWLGVEERAAAGRLAHLRQVLVAAFEAAGFDLGAESDRPLHAHVTVARPRRGAHPAPPGFSELAPGLDWDPPAAVCFESLPGAGGSHYEPLAVWPLESHSPGG